MESDNSWMSRFQLGAGTRAGSSGGQAVILSGQCRTPLTTTTLVRADGEWQSSGLYIEKGQRVVVVAAGAWRHDGYDDVFYGPDGVGI